MCLGIFGGRWGSYLGAQPIFVTDILIGLAVCHFLVSRSPLVPGRPKGLPVHPLVCLLLVWVVVRFLAGGDLSTNALRDAAPYFYCVLALVSALAVARAGPANRERTARLLMAALTGHSIWSVISVLWLSFSMRMPIVAPAQGLHLFAVRPDFDLGILGVYVACLFVRLMKGTNRPLLTIVWMMVCWVAILDNHSRAGLLGAVLAAVLAIVVCLRGRQAKMSRKIAVLGILPLLVAVVFLGIPQTQVGGRLTGGGGAGSQQARSNAWERLWHYSLEDNGRFLVGVGFGPNFMADSGASELLVGHNDEGEARPRSPHNYWVGTLVRTGLLGGALSLALLAVTLARIRALMPDLYGDPLLSIAAITVTALILPATLGVVFESPFGAVPYFWCVGLLLATRPPEAPHQTDHVLPAGDGLVVRAADAEPAPR